MQIGRQFRRAIPWTHSVNLSGDEQRGGMANRYDGFIEFSYGIGYQSSPYIMTGPSEDHLNKSAKQWRFSFSIELIEFTGRLGYSPYFLDAGNIISLQIVDPFGKSLTVTWYYEPNLLANDQIELSPDHVPIDIEASGDFAALTPYAYFEAVYYRDEPHRGGADLSRLQRKKKPARMKTP